MQCRRETPRDVPAIRELTTTAFGQADEASLVDELRRDRDVLLSLVAEIDGQIAGHVLFSRLRILTTSQSIAAAALAPVSVRPEFQRRGIGSALIRLGLEMMRDAGESIVIVVGDPRYYTRFGFSAERAAMLRSVYAGPAFMALELEDGALAKAAGDVEYPAAFGRLS